MNIPAVALPCNREVVEFLLEYVARTRKHAQSWADAKIEKRSEDHYRRLVRICDDAASWIKARAAD